MMAVKNEEPFCVKAGSCGEANSALGQWISIRKCGEQSSEEADTLYLRRSSCNATIRHSQGEYVSNLHRKVVVFEENKAGGPQCI